MNSKKKVQRLKTPGASEKEGKKKSLSELLTTGTVLSGTYRKLNNDLDTGDYTLTISQRDGKKVKCTGVLKSKKDPTPHEVEYEGEVDGKRLDVRSFGNASKISINVFMKGESSLEGSFFIQQSGSKGSIAFKLPKQ